MCISSAAITSKQQYYYAYGMYYTIGTVIDLTYLNKPKEVVSTASSFRQTASNLVDVGTQISFKLVGNKFTTVRRIPVAFA